MNALLIWTLKMFAVLSTFSQTLIVIMIWFMAFRNGDSVIVYINHFGEKYPELLMWIVCVPVFCYGTFLVVRELWKEGWRQRKRFRREMARLTGRKKRVVETLR